MGTRLQECLQSCLSGPVLSQRPTGSCWKAELEAQQAGSPLLLRGKRANKGRHSYTQLYLI